jgi:hypothetical protein
MQQVKKINILSVTSDGLGTSVFSSRQVDLKGDAERMLSEQISAVNFRLRESNASYASGWHVAGDATLLIILAGTICIELRNGDTRNISAGDMFVAEDFLLEGVIFDNALHGHRAKVVGDEALSVIHLKLEKRTP